jgi:DNA polymerase III subunit epsilon
VHVVSGHAGRPMGVGVSAGARAVAAADRPVADRLATLTYAVVDLETTGGSPWSGHRVTEIAAAVVRDGRVEEVFTTLVNPERSIPPFVTRLTHITSDMVRHQPTFREICPRVVEVLRGHVFVAHNAAFDWRFLRAEVARAGAQMPTMRKLCTVRLARRLLPHLRRRSLDQVAHYYGVPISDRHRAKGDAVATAHCLMRLLDEVGVQGWDTWTDLERLLRRPPRRRGRRYSGLPRLGDWEMGA